MGIILGALGGAAEAGNEFIDKTMANDAAIDKLRIDSDLQQQRAQALEIFKQNVANAPLERIGSSAQRFAGQDVPVSPPPVTNLTGVGASDDPNGASFKGDPIELRKIITNSQTMTAQEKADALAQLNRQVQGDAALNAGQVAGQTRPRTSDEAVAAALDEARLKDPVAYAAYQEKIAKPMRDERRVDVAEKRADNISDHYARMDDIRATGEEGKNQRSENQLAAQQAHWASQNTLTPEMQQTAEAIASGKLPPITGYGLRSPGANLIMAHVMQLNPDYNANDYGAAGSSEKAFATGKQGNAVRSFNVAISHLSTLSDLAGALKNGDTRMLNTLGNEIAFQTGKPAPTNFEAAKRIVGDEIVKAVTGSGGALGDREAAERTLNAANSPEQLSGVINTYQDLMRGQLDGLRQQYSATTGKTDFDERFLSDAARAVAHRTPAPGMSAGAPQVGTVRGAYRFNGGNPADPKSWSRVQ